MGFALPDLSIRQLEYLVAVADAPTWAVAAEQVGVSPSALSQGLAELERRIGVPLFERSGRRRSLRASSAPVLDHARQVVALTGDLTRWAERSRDADLGLVRLGMVDVAAVHHYPEVLRGFRAAHPDLQLRLRVAPSAALFTALVAGDLDLVIGVEPPLPIRGLTLEVLRTEELAVYRPGSRRPGPPTDWGPWVLFPEGSHTRALVHHALLELGVRVDVVAESHQPDVLLEMVELGLGWTVLPVVQAGSGTRALSRGRILTTRRLVTATRSGSVLDPAVAALKSSLTSA